MKNINSLFTTSLIEAHNRWPNDLEIIRIDIPSDLTYYRVLEEKLSEDEKIRAGLYRRSQDRLRFAATRASLRALLAARIGKSEDTLQFCSGQHGKPALAGHPDIFFNVTHSGDHALIALSDTRQVGVDIQVVESSFRWRELLSLVCTPREQQFLISGSEDFRRRDFFRCWTAKEALLKATGSGIGHGFQGVSLDLLSPSGYVLLDTVQQQARTVLWKYYWISEIRGYSACVAFETKHLAADISSRKPAA